MTTPITITLPVELIARFDRAHEAWLATKPGSEAQRQAHAEMLAEAHSLAVRASLAREVAEAA